MIGTIIFVALLVPTSPALPVAQPASVVSRASDSQQKAEKPESTIPSSGHEDSEFRRPRVARNQRRPTPIETHIQCWGCFTWKQCSQYRCVPDTSNRACNINQFECNVDCYNSHSCVAQ